MDNRARTPRGPSQTLRESLNLSTLGLTFAFSVLVGFGIGYLLDRLLHTSPWLMIIFIVLGFASGIVSIARAVRTRQP
jgi:ATP synthase protein I